MAVTKRSYSANCGISENPLAMLCSLFVISVSIWEKSASDEIRQRYEAEYAGRRDSLYFDMVRNGYVDDLT
jgi:hypothetical protein